MYQQNMKCPCGSGLQLKECCGPIIEGDDGAATAEQLMRTRYSAYVLGEATYLGKTWHPSTCPGEMVMEEQLDWLGLEVVKCIAGLEGDEEGKVEFIARYRAGEQDGELHELSRFVKEDGQWLYLDGDIKQDNFETDMVGQRLQGGAKKVGRNAPCPCGSGKKYKRCCGAA
jgi:SEC-C motif-containing protein